MLPNEVLYGRLSETGEWSSRDVRIIDYIFRERIRRAMTMNVSEGELTALQDLISRIATRVEYSGYHSTIFPESAAEWAARWRFAADLLDRELSARQDLPKSHFLERWGVRDIIIAIRSRGGTIAQSELAEHLFGGLPLLHILNVMEAHELIRRKSAGSDNIITVGPAVPNDIDEWS